MSRPRRRCEVCPKRDANGTCLIKARWMAPLAPACDYGIKLMKNEYSAEWMRRVHGHRKRPTKAPPKEAFGNE